jgi:cytochrome b561
MIVSNTSENTASVAPVQVDTSDAATAAAAAAPARYNAVAQWLHWLIGLAVLGQIALGWWMIGLPNTPPGYQAGWYNIHKSIGLSIGLLVLLRIVWRWRHPAPLLPATVAAWQRLAARCSHALLYLCLVLMPLSGFLGSSFTKYPIKFWGVVLPRWIDPSPAAKELCSQIHYVTVCLFMLLIAVHVAAAIKHALAGDGVFWRMWPGAAAASSEKS